VSSDYIPLHGWLNQSSAASRWWHIIDPLERAVALLAVLISAPLLLAAGVAIAISSRRSPLIAHLRVGRMGQPFWVVKLRTMWRNDVPQRFRMIEHIIQEPSLYDSKPAMDPRVGNAFAALCRRYSIDELPQLWQVVSGEMALIGPRPVTEGELRAHYGSAAGDLLTRKPGITGLWQIRGRSSLTYRQRQRLDLFLHRRWSLKLYLRIALSTIPAVLSGRNAW
jgi:exopolysaccharide production protein ExoY